MKLQHIALVCLLALSAGNVTAQMLHRPDSMYTFLSLIHISSNVDYLLAKRRWGIEFIDIPMEEVYCLFYQLKDDDIGYEASVFANRAIALSLIHIYTWTYSP